MTLYSITDLLLNMPPYLDKDAHAVPAFTLTYNGVSATVTIQTKTLVTSIDGGTGSALSVNLANYTIATLVTFLNGQTGYTAALATGANGAASALSLMEIVAQPLSAEPLTLYQFTSANWLIWMPILWQLQLAQINLQNALNELYITTGDSGFLDFWGRVYGNVTRNPNETDDAYALRIMTETTRPRLTALALEEAVLNEVAVTIGTTSRLSDVGFRWSHGGWNVQQYVTFPLYPTCFAVNAPSGGSVDITTVSPVIERNRAAGMAPIYNYAATPQYADLAVFPGLPCYPVRA
jgi:hypothetical protein